MTFLNKKIKNPDWMKYLFIAIIPPFSLMLKYFQFKLLPDKYFNQSVLSLVITKELSFNLDAADSFNNAAYLFQKINIMNLSTLLQWSLFITFFMSFYVMKYFLNVKLLTLKDYIISIFILAILNIYIFNIAKDIIQMLVFCIIYYVIKKKKLSIFIKAFLVFGLIVIESIFFRMYYVLIACFFSLFFVIFETSLFKFKHSPFKIVIMMLSIFYIFLIACRQFMPDEFTRLITIRDRMTLHRIGEDTAQTLIVNLINDNGTLSLFIINYLINSIRIMLPFELLLKGLYYYPFFVFQVLCTYILIKNIINFKCLNTLSRLSLYIMCAYYIVAFFFEPDFGTFVRHETATMPILMVLLLYNKS